LLSPRLLGILAFLQTQLDSCVKDDTSRGQLVSISVTGFTKIRHNGAFLEFVIESFILNLHARTLTHIHTHTHTHACKPTENDKINEEQYCMYIVCI